jgi:hypothetical protein
MYTNHDGGRKSSSRTSISHHPTIIWCPRIVVYPTAVAYIDGEEEAAIMVAFNLDFLFDTFKCYPPNVTFYPTLCLTLVISYSFV